MKIQQAKKLKHGIYCLFWRSGGWSVAAVGCNKEGLPWFAPVNWVSVPSYNWAAVETVDRISMPKQHLEVMHTEGDWVR